MRYGFHLASLPHHEIDSIAGPLYQLGYRAVVIRARARWLAQDACDAAAFIASLDVLRAAGLEVVIDADGKFLIDPWQLTAPRLANAGECARREAMLSQYIDFAKRIDCSLITFSVGHGDEFEEVEQLLKRIATPIARLLDHAITNEVTLAIKPELDSVIETASHFHRLLQWLPGHAAGNSNLGWAADIALMARRGELPIGDRLARDADRLKCVYLSDISAGAHGDYRFGSGDLAITRIVQSLHAMGYDGPLIVRCEGHGDAGLQLAKEAIELIR